MYTRVSSTEQAKGFSLQAQLDEIKVYCCSHNIEILRNYLDTQSATRLFKRRGFVALLDDLDTMKPDYVIATESDRVSRNLLQFGWIDTHLSMKSIKLIIVNEKPPDGPFEKAFIKIRAVFSEFETDLRQYRIDRGRERAIANQVFMHRPPLGYKLQKGQLIPCEKTAPIVRGIFRFYTKGKAIKAIARDYGKSPASIRYILNNPFYTNAHHLVPHDLIK